MGERRREVDRLDRLLARHLRRETRSVAALLELERDPWYLLLDAGGTPGHTALRWSQIRPVRDGLWRDFTRYGETLRSAERIRHRRGSADELRSLLTTADELAARIRPALGEVRALVAECAALTRALTAQITPAAQRLTAARRVLAELDLAPDDVDVVATNELATRLSAAERLAAADPLACAGSDVADLVARVDALLARLEDLTVLRARWSDLPVVLDGDLADVAAHRRRVATADARARALLRDTVPSLPPDRTTELQDLRETLTAADGWRERHDAVVALRERVSGTRAELDRAAALVDGTLDRRDDLRGRFEAYRARARRLDRVDDPELTELAARIGARLWSVPAELARATRDLAAYRRRLAALGTAAGTT